MQATRVRQFGGIAAIVAAIASPALGGTMVYDPTVLSFSTSGQSIWGTGTAAAFSNEVFVGATWDVGPLGPFGSISGSANAVVGTVCVIPNPIGGCLVSQDIHADTRTGLRLSNVSSNGKLGFNLGTSFDSGSVAANVGYQASLAVPDAATLQPGQFVSLNPSQSLSGSQHLATNFPSLQGYVDAVLAVSVGASMTACAATSGCITPNFSAGIPETTLELLSFNRDGGGTINYLNFTDTPSFDFDEIVSNVLGVPNFGEPVDLPSPLGLAQITVHLPNADASLTSTSSGALHASGSGDLLDFSADIDGIVSLGLTGTSCLLGCGFQVGLLDFGYDLLDVGLGPSIDIFQDFDLTPRLMVDLAFSREVEVAGLGMVSSLTAAWDALPPIAFLDGLTIATPTFWLDASLRNRTSLDIDLDVFVKALLAHADLTGSRGVFGADYPGFTILDETLASVSLPPIFDDQFAVLGFNRVQAAPFSVRTASAAVQVVEPASAATMLGAILGLAALRWRASQASSPNLPRPRRRAGWPAPRP